MSDKLQFVVLTPHIDKLKFVGHSVCRFTTEVDKLKFVGHFK